MNRACPACGREAVSVLRKILTSDFFPARCRHCDVMVASQRSILWALAVTFVDHVVMVAALFLAWTLASWLVLLAGVAIVLFVLPLAFEWWTSLKVVTPDHMWRFRRNFAIGIVVFVALVVMAGLTDR